MILKVNEDLCIGCGACAAIAPEVFELNDNGLAQAIMEPVAEEFVEVALEAKDSCPTSAIEEVENE